MTDPTPSEKAEFDARRRGRNRALGLALALFAILFFAITIAKLGLKAGGAG